MGPLWLPRGEETFLQDAGADAHTVGVSISSPRRATAGVQLSIDLELGPLFGLNAVRTIQARAPGAEMGARALGWPAASPPGPKSDQIGPNPVIACRMSPVGGKADVPEAWS